MTIWSPSPSFLYDCGYGLLNSTSKPSFLSIFKWRVGFLRLLLICLLSFLLRWVSLWHTGSSLQHAGLLLLWSRGSVATLCGLCGRGVGLVVQQHAGS